MSDAPYIIAAYTVTWVVLASYAVYLVVRGRRARRAVNTDSGGADA